MSSHSRNDSAGKPATPGGTQPDGATARPAAGGALPRVHSHELLRNGEQLIIEHAGREYRLRVTSNGKLILTA
jgi:hemin uptake protein HemP